MRDFKSYECEGQMELLDYMQHASFSCQREEADSNAAEEFLYRLHGAQIDKFHVVNKKEYGDGFLYCCKEGNIFVSSHSMGKEFFQYGIAAKKQMERLQTQVII